MISGLTCLSFTHKFSRNNLLNSKLQQSIINIRIFAILGHLLEREHLFEYILYLLGGLICDVTILHEKV